MIILQDITLIPLISLLLYVAIFIILITSNQTKLSKAFRWYIVSMIIWSFGSLLMKTDMPPSSLFWNKVLQIGFITVPVFLLRFSFILSKNHKYKIIVHIGYVLSAILVIMAVFNQVVVSATFENGTFTYQIGYGAYIVGIVGMSYSLLALILMMNKVRKQEIDIKKVRLVIIGLLLVVFGGALNLNTTIGKYGIDILFNAINAILITYSIYRNKFLEINLVVRKGLSLTVYNILLFTLYSTVVIGIYQLLIYIDKVEIIYFILIMAPIFILLEPLRRLLSALTTKVFYGATSDRQNILRKFSTLISTSLKLDSITRSLIHAIEDGVQAKYITVLLKNTKQYYIQETTISTLDDDIVFGFHHPIVTWFEERTQDVLLRNTIDNDVKFKSLWGAEEESIADMKTELIIPIRYLDELIGFVILSGKKDNTPYIEEEISFLQTVVNNASAIIENAKTIENIKKQSVTDELTKLYNHRYFHEELHNIIANNKYDILSIAMIDLDQFKIYNDLYGHSAGDSALQRIADILSSITSDDDIVVRYGGEEFIVVFPNLDAISTIRQIELVRKEVEEQFLLSDDIREFLTVTVGVATYPEHGETVKELVSKSDYAMRFGKRSGRNKVILYKEDNGMQPQFSSTELHEKMRDAYLSSVYALAATIDAKDHYTFGHSNNVAILAEALAKKAGCNEEEIELVKNAGLLHDIGKVGIPESVLSKPGLLLDEEMEIMRGHVIQSINIIKHIPSLVSTVPIIMSHHERYDGDGYPRGIKGENIPLLGRVICIADSFDAMTTDRPYRKGLSLEQSIIELKKHAGTQFDPMLVDLFVSMVKEGYLDELTLENRPSVL